MERMASDREDKSLTVYKGKINDMDELVAYVRDGSDGRKETSK